MTQLPQTYQDITDRIRRACEVMRTLPGARPAGYKNPWTMLGMPTDTPKETTTASDKWTTLPHEIDAMEEVIFDWFALISPVERRIVWKRFDGMGWKRLAGEHGFSVRSAQRYVQKACQKILDGLKKGLRKKRLSTTYPLAPAETRPV